MSTEFITISLLNRLINSGVERRFITAASVLWYLQATNDPNTKESAKLIPSILGALEHIFVEEARAVDNDLFKLFSDIIQRSENNALFSDAQCIFTVGLETFRKDFPSESKQVMEVYVHYANIMLATTKQDQWMLSAILKLLAKKVEELCVMADKAEKELF